MMMQTSPPTLQRAAPARPTVASAGLIAELPRQGSEAGAGWRARRAAFTMIELMVVLAIIGILIALLVLVGGRVAGTGKQSATQSMIKALDATLGAVTQDRGRLPRAVARDPRSTTSNEKYWPVADGSWRDSPGAAVINSGGWFLQMASEIPGASDLTGVDPELLRPYTSATGPIPSTPNEKQPQITTPMDAWGNPIRFVHPDFDGNRSPSDPWTLGSEYDYVIDQVIRIGAVDSPGDVNRLNADGGFAPGNQPYFYSAGPDGKVGVLMNGDEIVEDFNEDNVYSAKPEFDRESP